MNDLLRAGPVHVTRAHKCSCAIGALKAGAAVQSGFTARRSSPYSSMSTSFPSFKSSSAYLKGREHRVSEMQHTFTWKVRQHLVWLYHRKKERKNVATFFGSPGGVTKHVLLGLFGLGPANGIGRSSAFLDNGRLVEILHLVITVSHHTILTAFLKHPLSKQRDHL